jgi:DNA-binding MarR family transcriptional regulator
MCICPAAITSRAPGDHRQTMTDRNANRRRARDTLAGRSTTDAAALPNARALAGYVRRGHACAFANTRLLGRVVTNFYDEALRPAELRASQLALLWAILACEPVEMGRLGEVTQTDQTTLSRTVDKLRQAGLVAIGTGEDRRVRLLRLTPKGRRQFARAMPFWEEAQRRIDRWLSLGRLEELARQARRLARAGASDTT